jgi:hypothetical protein
MPLIDVDDLVKLGFKTAHHIDSDTGTRQDHLYRWSLGSQFNNAEIYVWRIDGRGWVTSTRQIVLALDEARVIDRPAGFEPPNDSLARILGQSRQVDQWIAKANGMRRVKGANIADIVEDSHTDAGQLSDGQRADIRENHADLLRWAETLHLDPRTLEIPEEAIHFELPGPDESRMEIGPDGKPRPPKDKEEADGQ